MAIIPLRVSGESINKELRSYSLIGFPKADVELQASSVCLQINLVVSFCQSVTLYFTITFTATNSAKLPEDLRVSKCNSKS